MVRRQIRRRACCSNSECSASSWTVYELGDYPRRGFSLQVVHDGICSFLFNNQSLTQAAETTVSKCSRRSIGRWYRWISELVELNTLFQLCARWDPSGVPPVWDQSATAISSERAKVLISCLEQWVLILVQRGVALPGLPDDPGWIRFLSYQLNRFGQVVWLTKSSPPMLVAPPPE